MVVTQERSFSRKSLTVSRVSHWGRQFSLYIAKPFSLYYYNIKHIPSLDTWTNLLGFCQITKHSRQHVKVDHKKTLKHHRDDCRIRFSKSTRELLFRLEDLSRLSATVRLINLFIILKFLSPLRSPTDLLAYLPLLWPRKKKMFVLFVRMHRIDEPPQ